MLGRKKKEGKPLPDTPDMKAWREEFNSMTLEDHDKVLKNLGLDDEDIEEFNQAEKGGKKLEDVIGLGPDGEGGAEDAKESTGAAEGHQEMNGRKGKK